ncbi:hypothetical protein HMPREF3144_06580 [Oligella sp. HMSC05A10]|uniref:hypothetical protein n=1 Tax=Oligella TaxID=90243 RepID=UPI0008A59F2D|nr:MULTISPECIES: hypothetical protein [Oligella]OFS84506.1 hypothetical protein HMPREF3144_06580 [Oligella sp. HMSC05A10]
MSIVNNLLKSMAIATMLYFVQCLLGLDYLGDFLRSNLVTILITVLAINTATMAVILAKMFEISREHNTAVDQAFKNTKKELLLSIREQIGAVIAAMMLSMLTSEKLPFVHFSTHIHIGLEILLISVFIYGLYLLYDTAKSVLSFYD